MKRLLLTLTCLGLTPFAAANFNANWDGRQGARAYDALMCYSTHLNACHVSACMNSEDRHCKTRICEPLARDKCRHKRSFGPRGYQYY